MSTADSRVGVAFHRPMGVLYFLKREDLVNVSANLPAPCAAGDFVQDVLLEARQEAVQV